MTALADLKTRIASEIDRTDATTAIASAVTSACNAYKFRRFAFNESSGTFTTIASTDAYNTSTASPGTLPTDIVELDTVTITVSSSRYQLEPVAYDTLDALSSTSTLTGRPTLYAWHAETIRLYPIPDAAYVITLRYMASIAEETWCTRAEELIRCRAKKELYAHFLFDPGMAASMEKLEIGALRELMREAQYKQASGRVRAWD